MRESGTAIVLNPAAFRKARVLRAAAGDLVVELASGEELRCDVVRWPGSGPLRLAPGDVVLVALDGVSAGRGYVLGTTEAYGREAVPANAEERALTGRSILLTADERIELRVGDNRVILTRDGKVEIRGRSIVSRARGVQRIRGAAVDIN